MLLLPQKLTSDSYKPYGQVIKADPEQPFSPANFGRAKRFNHLADLKNLRGPASLNVCVFGCSPWLEPTLELKVLERHQFSTQLFMPMASGRYITIVAGGDGAPDLTTMAAFIIDGPIGITYHPGVWHYPMTALDRELDMFCLVYEDGSADDCQILSLPEAVTVQL